MQTKKNRIDDRVRRTMKYMIIGSSIYALCLLIIITIAFIIFYKVKNVAFANALNGLIKNAICVIVGYLYSLIAIYSMTISVTNAVAANDEKFARGHMVIASLVRLLSFCIILIIVINEKTFGVVGGIIFLLAALGVKIGAYATPLLEKKCTGS